MPPKTPVRPHRLVLLGAPGVGKGTQAELLSERLHACHLSTGDIFRASKNLCQSEVSPAMAQALGCMKRGELVSDEMVLSLIAERARCLRCGGGILLDGFPRTVAQAEVLEELLANQNVKLDTVISYEMPLEKIVARLGGRRTCPKCKAVFHVETRPPLIAGKCDQCGTEIHQREDDRPESIVVRMDAYEKNTAPLIDFYRRRDLLVSVAADGTPDEIFWRSLGAIESATTRSRGAAI